MYAECLTNFVYCLDTSDRFNLKKAVISADYADYIDLKAKTPKTVFAHLVILCRENNVMFNRR